MTVNRFCSSGLQAIAMAADRIMLGNAEVIVAGGTESMSMVPMGGNKVAPNPWLMDHYPDAYLGMGLTAENLAQEIRASRAQQADEFSLASHQKALAAIAAGQIQGRDRSRRSSQHHRFQWRRARRTRQNLHHDFSTPTKARAPIPLSKRSQSSSPPFTRTARSPPEIARR